VEMTIDYDVSEIAILLYYFVILFILFHANLYHFPK